MKASTPSLIFYSLACFGYVLFSLLEMEGLVLCSKSIVVPCIFVYYFIENKYRIDWIIGLIFLSCFLGDVVVLFNIEHALLLSVYFFLLVYVLLLKYVLEDSKKVDFAKKDALPIFIIVLFLIYLLITILNIQFINAPQDNLAFIIYGITLLILSVISVSNYISKGCVCLFYMTLAVICFIFSDVFYALDNFYFSNKIFYLITLATQVVCYYFMVQYLLKRNKVVRKLN